MSNSLQSYEPALAAPTDSNGPISDSPRGPIILGMIILFIFFGGMGGWAFTAPLNGAVMGNAEVKVEGNRKSVEHLDGGIVQAVLVKEGDPITAGQVVVVLDDSQARAAYDVLAQEDTMLRATQARLLSELNNSTSVEFPDDLMERRGEPFVEQAIDTETDEFSSRRSALQGQRDVLEQRIAQLHDDIIGFDAQAAAERTQLKSVQDELAILTYLLKRQLVDRMRPLELDRTAAGLSGQIADMAAQSAKSREAIGEYQDQIAQLDKDRAAEITQSLSETRLKLLDVEPRLQSAATILAGMQVRSPYSGKVVDLAVFSRGQVIKPGERILDVVPSDTDMVVEAQIAVEDISDVHAGMVAEVRLTSYKQRITPLIHGQVIEVSADRLTNDKTGAPYYLAEVAVNPSELAASPQIQLYPGMPATVLITTQRRTALDYLVGPLVASFDHAFRQR